VFNASGNRMHGLWSKAGNFYAQMDANDGKQHRYRLDAATVPQAILARQALKMKQQRAQHGGSPVAPGRTIRPRWACLPDWEFLDAPTGNGGYHHS